MRPSFNEKSVILLYDAVQTTSPFFSCHFKTVDYNKFINDMNEKRETDENRGKRK